MSDNGRNNKESFFTLQKTRENMYRFLSRLYLLEVDEELLTALMKMKFPAESPDEELRAGYQSIKAYLEEASDKMEEAGQKILDDLAVDYARIFLSAGVAQGKAAFPFESVYTSKKHLMMQESRNDVIALYAEKGVTPGKDMYRIPEDHLGLLLEYMAMLCAEAVAAGDDAEKEAVNRAEQADFFKNHLLNWVPAFTVDMGKYASTDFYRGLAKLTRGFLNLERSLFAES